MAEEMKENWLEYGWVEVTRPDIKAIKYDLWIKGNPLADPLITDLRRIRVSKWYLGWMFVYMSNEEGQVSYESDSFFKSPDDAMKHAVEWYERVYGVVLFPDNPEKSSAISTAKEIIKTITNLVIHV